jgi:aldose 1-epimerase
MPYTLPHPKDFTRCINNKDTGLWVLENEFITCAITNYGVRIVSLVIKNITGNETDIALGYNTLEQYRNATDPYYGAIVGRYANRIAHAQFTLGANVCRLAANDGENILHGGIHGFHNQVWDVLSDTGNSLYLSYCSPDGEEGFPGNLAVTVWYELRGPSLRISYSAETDKPTVVNLSNHTYFNLNGEGSGTVNNHILFVNAAHYTPVNSHLIPTGTIAAVESTPFHFLSPHTIGEKLTQKNEQLFFAGGYDHNFVLNKTPEAPDLIVTGDKSGISMEVFSDQPGMQLYGGNAISGMDVGKTGVKYKKQEAFVIEPQHFPDAPNHNNFPAVILVPGQKFLSTSIYNFMRRL